MVFFGAVCCGAGNVSGFLGALALYGFVFLRNREPAPDGQFQKSIRHGGERARVQGGQFPDSESDDRVGRCRDRDAPGNTRGLRTTAEPDHAATVCGKMAILPKQSGGLESIPIATAPAAGGTAAGNAAAEFDAQLADGDGSSARRAVQSAAAHGWYSHCTHWVYQHLVSADT
jgi:hypothetical protein